MTTRRTKKPEGGCIVKIGGLVSDGNGGFHAKGDKITPCDSEAEESLRAKGLIE